MNISVPSFKAQNKVNIKPMDIGKSDMMSSSSYANLGVSKAKTPSKDVKMNKDGDSFEIKKDVNELPKGSNQTRGLKVIDKEIQDCKREDFESDESFRQHKQMLLEERRKLVETDGEAKAKKAEANGNAASKILEGTGKLLSGAGELAGKLLPFLMK